jgi:hypothetical protein
MYFKVVFFANTTPLIKDVKGLGSARFSIPNKTLDIFSRRVKNTRKAV